jgi:hypothetical protein
MAAATTGPASGPRPTSSTPATSAGPAPRVLARGRATAVPTSLRLVAQLGLLADAVAQVVELRATAMTGALGLDLGDPGRMHGEDALDAHAVRDATHREGLGGAGRPARSRCRENLHALLVAFADHHVHVDRCPRCRTRGGRPSGFRRRSCSAASRSSSLLPSFPAAFAVPSTPPSAGSREVGPPLPRPARACALRHAAISAWLPDRRISGTRIPRNSAGRVYCGYSRNRPEMTRRPRRPRRPAPRGPAAPPRRPPPPLPAPRSSTRSRRWRSRPVHEPSAPARRRPRSGRR